MSSIVHHFLKRKYTAFKKLDSNLLFSNELSFGIFVGLSFILYRHLLGFFTG